jgi:hypothetical protein
MTPFQGERGAFLAAGGVDLQLGTGARLHEAENARRVAPGSVPSAGSSCDVSRPSSMAWSRGDCIGDFESACCKAAGVELVVEAATERHQVGVAVGVPQYRS